MSSQLQNHLVSYNQEFDRCIITKCPAFERGLFSHCYAIEKCGLVENFVLSYLHEK
jgi:hypothetical protein